MIKIINDLNKLNDKPNNINDYVLEGDPCLTLTLYHPTAEFLALKVEGNNIQFKASLPEDNIFLWFALDFNK